MLGMAVDASLPRTGRNGRKLMPWPWDGAWLGRGQLLIEVAISSSHPHTTSC